ncbi:unnamed protein product [Hymenolepis diminuta]|uniref:RT_RNaseH_2 domain-containing protein n=1 Tax=Hymenolepis diminuta TaxID=6216 RepID=A0A0R3SEX1_HYMDI|nr:unnamed protein product [Hymenolepis diminuta]
MIRKRNGNHKKNSGESVNKTNMRSESDIDLNVTVEDNHHPLLVTEDIFTTLNSDMFAKLVLRGSSAIRDGSEKAAAHVSRSLTPAERNYGQIKKEAFIIVHAVKKFCTFVCGLQFLPL